MKNILAYTNELNNGASIPRVHSLESLSHNIRLTTSAKWEDINWADIVMIHRPVDPHHFELCKLVKSLGKKLWIDNDDDQLNLPLDHPSYFIYQKEERKYSIRESNRLADVVTISNPQILKSYNELNSNIVYYPCAYPTNAFEDTNYFPIRNKTIVWRGSSTHKKSLLEYSDAIAQVGKWHLDWSFVFIGDNPWMVTEKLENSWYVWDGFLPPQELWKYMKNLRAAIQIVPLTDNQFTRSRSNMAYLDATIAGANVLAPDWPHWKCPGITNYISKSDFIGKLDNLIDKHDKHINFTSSILEARNYILANQTFEAINKSQIDIIDSLFIEEASLEVGINH